jgi:predicted nucleic acid-binding Zn ribbon protein
MTNVFKTTCPRCGAPPETAKLEIISGEFTATGIKLYSDGFSLDDYRKMSTSEEVVQCMVCEASFPLRALMEKA